jgi:hypothetical protein
MYKYQEDLNFHKQNPDPVICTTKEDLYSLGQFRYGTYLPIHKQDLLQLQNRIRTIIEKKKYFAVDKSRSCL